MHQLPLGEDLRGSTPVQPPLDWGEWTVVDSDPEASRETTSTSPRVGDDLERRRLTPLGSEKAQVLLLTFSRSHPAFGKALIEDAPELTECRDALRIAVLGHGAKVLVFSEHFEPQMEALGYYGYFPDRDFGPHQVFTELSLESAIGEIATRVNAKLKKKEKFYEKQQSRTVVPLAVAAKTLRRRRNHTLSVLHTFINTRRREPGSLRPLAASSEPQPISPVAPTVAAYREGAARALAGRKPRDSRDALLQFLK